MGTDGVACNTKSHTATDCEKHGWQSKHEVEVQDTYFPPSALDVRPDLHDFRSRWYSSHLHALQEQPLHPPAHDRPALYRFLWLPTFDHPVAVTLANAAGEWAATFKRTNGHGGYEPGALSDEVGRSLTAPEAQQFIYLLEVTAFWAMESFEDSNGCDGSQLILEAVVDAKYHIVDRWSPSDTPYAALFAFVLGLCPASWEVEPY